MLNPSLDKISGCNNTQSAGGCVSKIEEILNTFSLIDIWRKKHGKKKNVLLGVESHQKLNQP